MQEKNNSTARIILPAIAIATSFYYSLSFTLGIILGYVACKIFFRFFVNTGKVDYIFVDFGNWKLHLHHWIMGVALLAIIWIVDFFYLPSFFAGVICGGIVHDIYDFNDWYKVISRNKPAVEKIEK